MEAPLCSGCLARDARLTEQGVPLAALEEEVRQLQALLGRNASNSSTPPSANPLGAPKPVVKKKSKRKPGGQPGHPPRLKRLLPPERVQEVIPFVPQACQHCHAALSYFTGCHGVSKRGVEEIADHLFAAPLALPGVLLPFPSFPDISGTATARHLHRLEYQHLCSLRCARAQKPRRNIIVRQRSLAAWRQRVNN